VLREGLRGEGVHALQAGLNRWLRRQQMPLIMVDGIFGPRTEAAVRTFQEAMSLKVDGIVGLKTWKEILSSAALGGLSERG
jgi:peptidoglycan hydrolase-like protein with peptidoglycan-binding domain